MEFKRKPEFNIMTDMLIVLLAAAVMALYYYGMRAAAVIAVTVIVSAAADLICLRLRKKERDKKDLSALLTGLTLGLMMSASVPYLEAAAAAIFAVVIAKHAFGGHGCEIFNPAAVGFLFASLCFPENMLTYPRFFADIPMSSVVPSDILTQSMDKTFLVTGTSSVSLIDVLTGRFTGPMGTGFVVVLAVAAAFLMVRRSISAITFFTEFAVMGLYAFIRYDFDPMSVLYFFAGGMTLFGMIFLSCDYSVIPKTASSRFLYGLTVSVCMIMFCQYSGTENAVVYAVIISSPIGIELDRRALSFADMLKKRRKRKSLLGSKNKLLGSISETLEMLDKDNKHK
ncbi:MAG: RnfABCDGE type electron transport complex subunit D [Prevotella sp.]|nr:RnfABCDGE type electron transport complex subunit D [Prevotella sp.]